MELIGHLWGLDRSEASVGIKNDNHLCSFLIHAIVFAQSIHHPSPKCFGIARIYTVAKEDDGFEVVESDVDVLAFFILHLEFHCYVVLMEYAGFEDGAEVVAYRLDKNVK